VCRSSAPRGSRPERGLHQRERGAARAADFATEGCRVTRIDNEIELCRVTAQAIARGEVVRLLFGYGRMDEGSIERTATTLLWLLLALTSESMIAILARAFYAGRDTRTPVVAAIVAVAINVSLSILLAGPLGLAGIGLAITVGSWAEAVVLIAILAHRMPAFGPGGVLRAGALALGAGLLATGAAFVAEQALATLLSVDPGKLQLALELGVTAVVGGLVYAGLAFVLHVPELGTIVDLVVAVVRRRTISA